MSAGKGDKKTAGEGARRYGYRLPAPGTAPQRDTLAHDHGGIRPRLLAHAFSGKLRGHLPSASRTDSQPRLGSL